MKKTENKISLALRFGYKVEEIMIKKNLYAHNIFKKENGLSRRAYFRLFEKGSNPTFNTICAIARALKVEPQELMKLNLTKKPEKPGRVYINGSVIYMR